MLSVQVPGCAWSAGMERRAGPPPPLVRDHQLQLEWENQQALEAMVGRLQEMVEQDARARSAAVAERLRLPPNIQLPDGEMGPDRHLQLRVPYQQAELTRSFQPPPNKCVSDVPELEVGGGGLRPGGGSQTHAHNNKKDSLLSKMRWWVRRGGACGGPPPCVMVPRRTPPAPAPAPASSDA